MAATMPTRGARERTTEEWAGHPGVAFALRALVFLAPVLAGWLVVRSTADHYWRPAGGAGIAAWLAQVVVLGSATVVLVGRAARRLMPLAALYKLTIAFPDHAPSRFRVALRSGNLRTVQARFADVRANGFGADRTEAMSAILEMVAALSKHEPRTRGHTDRVRAFTDLIGEEMGLHPEDRDKLRWAAMLHDIGKLAVPAEILNKPGRPTNDEWRTLVRHPAVGAEIVEELADWLGDWRFAAFDHHERWDGKGYPRALAGEQISLAGRIVAVADAYDVITSVRSYKKPMSAEAARRELVRCAGTQFDPAVVRAFLNVSVGRRAARAGMLGWLLEVPRGLANLASHTAGAAGGVVVASSIAAAAAVATVGPPPAPVAAPPVEAAVDAVAATTTEAPVAEVVAAREEPVVTEPRAVAPATSAAVEAVPEPGPGVVAAPAPTTAPTTTRVAPAATTTRAPSAPRARDDATYVRSGTTATVDVLANDSDADGDLDPSTLTIVDAPWAGSAVVAAGKIRITAASHLYGTVLRYRVCDRGGRCDTAMVYTGGD